MQNQNNLNRSLPPQFNSIDGIQLISPVESIFENGLGLFLFDSPGQELVRLEWIFNNVFDENENPLLNTTLSAMIKEGTLDMSSAEIAEVVDYYGAYLIPEYSYDQTSITLYVLNKHIGKLLPVIKQLLTQATFPQNELDTYVRNNKQTLSISLQKNDFVARRLFYTDIFGENRYGTVPTVEQYDSITREQIIDLYTKQVQPHNCNLFISGKIDSTLMGAITTIFGEQWAATHPEISLSAPILRATDGKLIYEERKEALQSAIRLGYPIIGRSHIDFPEVQVVNTLLGGFFGSRLMRNIREEKGYTYSIGSAVASLKHGGFFTIASEVGAEFTQATLTEIDTELDKLQQELVSEEELATVKSYMLGSMLGSLESIFSHADKFKNVHYSGISLDYYDRYTQAVKSITAQRVRDIAKKYFRKENLVRVVVGKLD
ncbi:M16 family metallopeptidase [Sphingobacterium sp. SYP-B4668]|uniref:M16 family metallopeptidase n=1 Tax=Sphingobacterium sp. SYP-B4668 TaxID=2996035 RepID=UPI0022DE30CD|nr:pitrilysin family protein [Sphingobacterium sp. SYP-B4668]